MYIIYKLDFGDECYIGSTKNLNKRIYDHKDRAKNEKYSHMPLYKKIKEFSFKCKIINSFDCDKKEILKHEQNYIELFKPTLNSRKSYLSIEEKRDRNKIRMRKVFKDRTEEQKKKVRDKAKLYYEKNKEKLKKKRMEYYYKKKNKILLDNKNN